MKKLILLKILAIFLLSSCSKEITKNVKVADLVNVLKEKSNSIESIFGFIDQSEDIKLTFHHYHDGSDGRFKLMKYANKDVYSNIELQINEREISFPQNPSVVRDESALFLGEYYGRNNTIQITLDESKKLEYELSFPQKLAIISNTPSYMIPNKTEIIWDEDKESDSLIGLLIEYRDTKNTVVSNYKILPDNGKYILERDLFDGIPENSKVYFKAFRGKYLKDYKNNLRIIIFSADYSSELFTSKYPSL